jgi:hypothetical protein
MKPQLPREIEALLPDYIVRRIYEFVPHLPKPKKSPAFPITVSPCMERDLRLLPHKTLRGKNEMYLKELDDFVLD